MSGTRWILLVALAISTGRLLLADWPQFLGPHRDGVSAEAISMSWSGQQPKVVWKKPVGAGFAGPVVAGDTLIQFHREGKSEILLALDAGTGARRWESKAPATYRDDFGFDEGPRATPCVAGGKVFSIGAAGIIRCVDLATGKQDWSLDAKADFKFEKGFFGVGSSPLAAGGNILFNIGGGGGAGIVALDQKTGKLRWKATSHDASYASPVLSADAANAVFFTREGLAIIDLVSGAALAEFSWRSKMHASVNAATPLVVTNHIFLTSSYDTGAILLKLDTQRIEKVWSGDDALSSHYATPVHHQGFLYGFHGRQEYRPALRCVELGTGKVRWSEERFGTGSLTLVGGALLILHENGELLLAPASPEKFAISGREQILGSEVRAHPAVSGKRLFARDKGSLVCVSLP